MFNKSWEHELYSWERDNQTELQRAFEDHLSESFEGGDFVLYCENIPEKVYWEFVEEQYLKSDRVSF